MKEETESYMRSIFEFFGLVFLFLGFFFSKTDSILFGGLLLIAMELDYIGTQLKKKP